MHTINIYGGISIKRLEGLARKAIQKFNMVEAGDKIAVGVSGGKDSIALTVALARLRRYCKIPFEICAVTIDPRFGGVDTDYSILTEYLQSLGVEHHIYRSDIGSIVFDIRKEKHPCSLCAVLRRGALHSEAVRLGCNRIALGHHLDDAIETFYMNLFTEGRIDCFSPKSYLSRRDLWLIRPLILATEAEVIRATRSEDFPVAKSGCPVDGVTNRQTAKEFVSEKAHTDPAFRQKMLKALLGSKINGWNTEQE